LFLSALRDRVFSAPVFKPGTGASLSIFPENPREVTAFEKMALKPIWVRDACVLGIPTISQKKKQGFQNL
jgi:hypothetical protein